MPHTHYSLRVQHRPLLFTRQVMPGEYEAVLAVIAGSKDIAEDPAVRGHVSQKTLLSVACGADMTLPIP